MSTAVARRYHPDPTRDERYKQAVCFRWVQAWQTALEVEAGLAPRTRLDYLRSAAVFAVQHDVEPREWTHHDCAATLASFPAGSRRKVRAHLNSLLSWLEEQEEDVLDENGEPTGQKRPVVDRNPMRRLRKPRAPGQRVPDIFTDPEVMVMCANPLLALMLHTGLRKGECRRLRRRHINLDRGELRVLDGKGGKDRAVPLNLTAQKAVADIDLIDRIAPDDHLWWSRPGGGQHVERSRPVGEATFARWWRQALEACDVDYRNPHTSRHTFATRYLRAGGRLETLRIIMGHASSRTTVDLYAHLDLSDARADVLLLDAVSV